MCRCRTASQCLLLHQGYRHSDDVQQKILPRFTNRNNSNFRRVNITRVVKRVTVNQKSLVVPSFKFYHSETAPDRRITSSVLMLHPRLKNNLDYFGILSQQMSTTVMQVTNMRQFSSQVVFIKKVNMDLQDLCFPSDSMKQLLSTLHISDPTQCL